MIVYSKVKVNRKGGAQGRGIINNLIDSLPIELHSPGYQFCGPGTKLKKRHQADRTAVTNAMKAKTKFCLRIANKRSKTTCGKKSFSVINNTFKGNK